MSFAELREKDRLLSRIAPEIAAAVPAAMKGAPLEKTGEVLASLLSSLESLKAGVIDLAESGNVYATNALFRVFLEHMLKTLGMYMKALNDLNDEFAELYLRQLPIEAFQYLKAVRAGKLDDAVARDSILGPWIAEGEAMTGPQRKEIEDPFKYKALIATISEHTQLCGPTFLTRIIPNYAELSGFVHGGPSTKLILEGLPTDERRAEKLLDDAVLVLGIFCSAKRWLLSLVAPLSPELEAQHDQFSEAMSALL